MCDKKCNLLIPEKYDYFDKSKTIKNAINNFCEYDVSAEC